MFCPSLPPTGTVAICVRLSDESAPARVESQPEIQQEPQLLSEAVWWQLFEAPCQGVTPRNAGGGQRIAEDGPTYLTARPTMPARIATAPRPSEGVEVGRIVRAHFLRGMLDGLGKLQHHYGDSQAARYAGAVLRHLRALEDAAPNDPFTELALALHDALAYENRWVDYTPEQYGAAIELLQECGTADRLDHRTVRKACRRLERDLGFDTVPLAHLLLDESE